MKHNFDAAITHLDAITVMHGDEGPVLDGMLTSADHESIQFALKFTKAALSGEVSDSVAGEGGDVTAPSGYLDSYNAPCGTECARQVFTAMCQQLAKEIG